MKKIQSIFVLTMLIMLSSFTTKQSSPETSPNESTRYCYIYGYGGGTFEYHVIFSNVVSIPSSATKDELIEEFKKYCLHSSSFWFEDFCVMKFDTEEEADADRAKNIKGHSKPPWKKIKYVDDFSYDE